MKTYTVIAISKNTNSFGLREHLFLAPCGSGWRALRSLYSGTPQFKPGDKVSFDEHEGPPIRDGFECRSRLAQTDPEKARKIVDEAARAAESLAS